MNRGLQAMTDPHPPSSAPTLRGERARRSSYAQPASPQDLLCRKNNSGGRVGGDRNSDHRTFRERLECVRDKIESKYPSFFPPVCTPRPSQKFVERKSGWRIKSCEVSPRPGSGYDVTELTWTTSATQLIPNHGNIGGTGLQEREEILRE